MRVQRPRRTLMRRWLGCGGRPRAIGIGRTSSCRMTRRAEAAWVHAYLHRVEGDLGNAGYWYRRAGRPVADDAVEAEWERIAVHTARRQDAHECGNPQTDQGRYRRLGSRHRPGGPRPGHLEVETVFRRLHRLRRRSEHARLAGRRRDAGHAAGDQRGMRPPGGAHRPRPQRQDQPALGVRPQELFLCRLAAGLPDQPVQVADRRRGRGRAGARGRTDRQRSGSSGCIWNRTPASCCTTSRRRCPMSTSTAAASP